MAGSPTALKLSEIVREALASGQAVVALESTIITHGLPAPHNLEVAQAAEQAIRDAGATPATIAVIDGRLSIGLSGYELERLADPDAGATKCSRRDLPFAVLRGETAGTTVAATMNIAAMAGIQVFATGGIGGVHPGAGESFDISADLQELARTPVAVVCAGPKSILDIRLTLEYLETHGVPVIAVGADELPAFYTPSSGLQAPERLDEPGDIARLLRLKWSLGLDGGVVVANPVPEAYAMDSDTVTRLNGAAMDLARQRGIHGKSLTPFLLARMAELSDGRALEANRALLLGNARLAAQIAIALTA